jgi:hypothetical protein
MPTPVEQSAGLAPGEATAPPAAAPPLSAQQVAAAIANMPPPPAPTPTVMSTPATADDVDVIEKEWVDQAEQVIQASAGDPHGEEEAVEKLQIDYLQKRYGHTVKPADDEPTS